MKLHPAYIVVPVAAVIGFFAARYWHAQESMTAAPELAAPAISKPVYDLPDFSLTNRAGDKQSIQSWPGKTLLINFWATWCAPCRREIPMLKAMQDKHAIDGLQVVGVAVDFRDAVLKYADQMQINYPLLIGEQDGLAAVDAFGLQAVGFPYTVFVDAKNNVISTYIGELSAPQVEAALAVIARINRGDLPVGEGRTEVTATLAELKSQMRTD